MMKQTIAIGLLAGALCIGAQLTPAAAAVSTPGVAPATAGFGDLTTEARWVCVGNRCEWRPGHRGRPHRWARGWAEPRRPGCFYERRRGRWAEVCG
jgi:hypothetical protein